MHSLPNFEPVYCSMSSSNRCFLTCIQVSLEEGKVLCYSDLLKNFPQFVVIYTVKNPHLTLQLSWANTQSGFFFKKSCSFSPLPHLPFIFQPTQSDFYYYLATENSFLGLSMNSPLPIQWSLQLLLHSNLLRAIWRREVGGKRRFKQNEQNCRDLWWLGFQLMPWLHESWLVRESELESPR